MNWNIFNSIDNNRCYSLIGYWNVMFIINSDCSSWSNRFSVWKNFHFEQWRVNFWYNTSWNISNFSYSECFNCFWLIWNNNLFSLNSISLMNWNKGCSINNYLSMSSMSNWFVCFSINLDCMLFSISFSYWNLLVFEYWSIYFRNH